MKYFYSFSQYYEDLVLHEALKDVKSDDIFWIDIGANDPFLFSDTKAFSLSGGRGINVEPLRDKYELLVQDRPRDISLNLALGEKEGVVPIVVNGCMSTVADIAESRWKKSSLVKMKTFNQIADRYVRKHDIHFCKIDVEGYEKSVIKGMNLIKYRPWILLIESNGEEYREWENDILNAQYEFVMQDKINRWYIACEKPELKQKVKPSNGLLDEYLVVRECEYIDAISREMRRTWSFRIGYSILEPFRKLGNILK